MEQSREKFKNILDEAEDKNPANQKDGQTPLHIAALKGHLQICSLMIGHNDGKIFDFDTFTPLHMAAIAGCLKAFKVIMESQIEKNPADGMGETPLHLHLAAVHNHFDICKLIISNVNNIHPTTLYMKTPKDYAILNKNWEIVRLFES